MKQRRKRQRAVVFIGVGGILEAGMKEQLTLSIDGMHCDACVRRVTTALQRIEGVNIDTVKVGSAQLSFDPEETSPKEIAEAVNRIGFRATAK